MSQDTGILAALDPALVAAAQRWLAEDPDPATRAELDLLLKEAVSGDAAAVADLTDRFTGRLQFGTAGLRGEMGAGPQRMNRVTVLRAAAGLAAFLTETFGPGAVVAIGHDARHNSRQFAHDTAAVMAGAGHRPRLLSRALPTPTLAFAVRHLGAKAGVMVTASHNPARDNGYKVYLDDGSQIAPPNDALIAAKIDAVGALADVPLGEYAELPAEEILAPYVARSAELVAPGAAARDVRIVYTAMHGVGWELFHRVLTRSGFAEPIPVPEQAAPDPDFPTVAFPNPEEAGALDLAFALAEATGGVDVVLANDPDADRLAVAVRDPAAGRWRQLSGDDTGMLLGRHLAGLWGGDPSGAFASTIVSSSGLAAVCAAAGRPYARTLTGFKWLSKVPGVRYAYEEAIGYCCDPAHVNDKDGVTAGLLVADLVARLKAEGRTLLDALADLDRVTGNLVTAQLSIRSDDADRIQALMSLLRTAGPAALGGLDVREAGDLTVDGRPLPAAQGLHLRLADGGRTGWIAVRPSGTEPKLKCYIEVGDPAAPDRRPAVAAVQAVQADLAAWFAAAG